MKKILLIAAVAGFVMTSCKKDYTCECTTTGTGSTQVTTFTITDTKSKATDACEGTGSVVGPLTTTCKIK